MQDPAHYGEKQSPTRWGWSDALRSWNYRGYTGKPIVELVSGRNWDENKAAFLLDHLVFTDAMNTTAPEHISAFDKLMGVGGYFNIAEQFFYGNIYVRRHEGLFRQAGIAVSLMEGSNDLPLLPKSRRVVDGFQGVPVCSVHHQI